MIAFPRTISAAALLALTALASPASAALDQLCVNLPKTLVIVNSVSQSTDSTAFVDVDGSNTSVRVAGSVPSCVLVSFSAQAFAPGPGAVMRVRALLDGKQSVEGEISFAAESDNFATAHAYNFLFPSVSPGLHVFNIEYRSVNNDTVTLNDFSFNIRHR